MDIVRKSSKKSGLKNPWVIVGAACALSIAFIAYGIGFSTTPKINADELITATVEQDEFIVNVRGMGVLAPKNERWITTSTNASVEQIFVKPGTMIEVAQPIMRLSNPDLIQELNERKWELDEMAATNIALKASLDNQLLDLESAVLEARLNYERSLLTLDAQRSLMKDGVNAVSRIDFETTKIDVEQNQQRWQLAKDRLESQRKNIDAQLIASNARYKRLENLLAIAQTRVDSLMVTATQTAVIQELPIELGQRVIAGTNLVKIASSNDFIAELRIPENLINQVNIGQPVSLDSRTSVFRGRVNRIDPTVVNGLVQVDVDIIGQTPAEARPDLTIEGTVEIARKEETLFVRRPMYARSLIASDVFVLSQDGTKAIKTTVEFGQSSSTHIEVVSGINAGQEIIISDATQWADLPNIQIN